MIVDKDSRKTVKDDYIYKHVKFVGEEDEGACNRSQSESGSFHHDSSVEVCGNEDSCDGDCSYDCDCDGCRLCDICDYSMEECDCDECKRCDECDCRFEDCSCYITSAVSEDCSECIYIHPECDCATEESIACQGHQRQAFMENSYGDCESTYQHCEGNCGCEIYHECGMNDDSGLIDGEMVSPPLRPAQLADWSRQNYPEQVNTTCGSHQHTSLNTMKDYSIVLDRSFETYVIRRLTMWGKQHNINEGSALYRRLAGDKHWCKKGYKGYEQLITSSKDECRYQIVNYCYLLHGTVEVRVLPAFSKVELNISAHKELTRSIEQFIEMKQDSLTQRRVTKTMEVMV